MRQKGQCIEIVEGVGISGMRRGGLSYTFCNAVVIDDIRREVEMMRKGGGGGVASRLLVGFCGFWCECGGGGGGGSSPACCMGSV